MQPTELKKLPDWLLEQLPQITEPAILSLIGVVQIYGAISCQRDLKFGNRLKLRSVKSYKSLQHHIDLYCYG